MKNKNKTTVQKETPGRPVRRLSIQSDDRQEAETFLSNAYVPVRVEVPPRSVFDYEMAGARCAGVDFSRSASRSGFALFFETPFDGYSLSFPSAGSLSVDQGAREPLRASAGGALMLDLTAVTAVTLSPGSAWQRIAVGSEEMHRHVTALTEQPVRQRVRFATHVQADRGIPRAMLEIGRAIVEGMRDPAPLLAAPAAVASLREAVLSMFVQGMAHGYSEYLGRQAALPAPRHVKRAIEFMHANLLEPLRLEDIAQAAQTSQRSLQMAFRQFRDTTPMDYLRRLRLDGARDELMRSPPGTSVAEVAYRWGFAHHGMFASRYARLFGELPSETLRQHRRD